MKIMKKIRAELDDNCVHVGPVDVAVWVNRLEAIAKAQSAELSRAYALIEEMRAGLERIAKVDPGNEFSQQSGMAKKILTKTDTFLAERVK